MQLIDVEDVDGINGFIKDVGDLFWVVKVLVYDCVMMFGLIVDKVSGGYVVLKVV